MMNGTIGQPKRRLLEGENREKNSTPLNLVHPEVAPDSVKTIHGLPHTELRTTPSKHDIF